MEDWVMLNILLNTRNIKLAPNPYIDDQLLT